MKKSFFLAVLTAACFTGFSTTVPATAYEGLEIAALTDRTAENNAIPFLDECLDIRPYALFSGFADAGGCRFYFVIIFEDHNNSDPIDDTHLASGWVSDCPRGPGIRPQSEPEPSLKETFGEDFTTPSELGPVREFELSPQPLSLYPNPAKEYIRVDVNNEEIKSGFVTTAEGHIVNQLSRSDAENFKVKVSGWPAGTYIVYLLTVNDEVLSGKFIIP